jgi:hypothetical protein
VARPKHLVPPLRFHAPTKQWYIWNGIGRTNLGRDEATARKRYEAIRDDLLARAGLAPTPQVSAPAAHTGRELTVAEAALAYTRHAADEYAGNRRTLGRVRTAMSAVTKVCGTESVATFRAKSLKQVRDWLLLQPVRHFQPASAGQTLARAYVNSLIGTIQQAWDWLAAEDLVPNDNANNLRKVKSLRKGKGGRETDRVTPVEAWAVDATLPHCNHVVRAMAELQRLTGMRPGEVCRLTRDRLSIAPEEKIPLPNTRQRVGAMAVDGLRARDGALGDDAPARLHAVRRRVLHGAGGLGEGGAVGAADQRALPVERLRLGAVVPADEQGRREGGPAAGGGNVQQLGPRAGLEELIRLGLLYAGAGEHAAALALFERCARVAPTEYLAMLAVTAADAAGERAKRDRLLGDYTGTALYAKLAKAFREALAGGEGKGPDLKAVEAALREGEARVQQEGAYFVGCFLAARGRSEEAAAYLRRCMAGNDGSPEIRALAEIRLRGLGAGPKGVE